MDVLLRLLHVDVICQGGSQGLAFGEFWNLARSRHQELFGVELKDSAQLYFWDETLAFDHFIFSEDNKVILNPEFDTKSSLTISVSLEERVQFYTEGRPLKLNEAQMQTFEILARAGKKGVTQAEVAKVLSLDPRSLFHHLKAPLKCGLLSRLPVSYQRTFTYLLYLSRFSPEREDFELPSKPESHREGDNLETAGCSMDKGDAAQVLPSVVSIRTRILDILHSAPQMTLASKEVYRLLGNPQHIKAYRRSITWLVCHGFIECFIAEELGGVSGKILKFKKAWTAEVERRPPSTTITTNNNNDSNMTELTRGGIYAGALVKSLALERQVHDYIDAKGCKGATLGEAMWDLGLSRKLAYRIGDRLVNPKIFGNSDIIRVPEFMGKERRHRFYTKSGQTRLESLPTPSEDLNSTGSFTGNSVTRARRLKALLEIVNESVIIESGKSLVGDLQRRLGEQDYMMDSKTLRRLITHLEETGKLRTIVVAISFGANRTILLKSELSPDDPQVQSYIDNMKRNRIELTSPTAAVEMDSIAPVSLSREHKYRMQKYGYVYGILKRCRILHEYLLEMIVKSQRTPEQDNSWLCETLPAFFRKMTLSIFLKIVGVGEMSKSLLVYLADPANGKIQLESLPPMIKEEIHRRRVDRHKIVVKNLMETLIQLGLATVDNRYPSVAFKLPFQYRLSRVGSVIDVFNGKVLETVDLTCPTGLQSYWNWLGGLMGEDSLKFSPSLPKVFTLATHPESWQVISPFSRSFRKALRRLILLKTELDVREFEIEMSKLATDFELDGETVRRAFIDLDEEIQKERNLRIAERRAKRAKIEESSSKHGIPRPTILPRKVFKEKAEGDKGREGEDDDNNDNNDNEVEEVATHRIRRQAMPLLSEKELDGLGLSFLLVQKAPFRTATGMSQWGLVEGLYKSGLLPGESPRSSEEIRGLFSRFVTSIEQNRRMWVIENRMRLVDLLGRIGIIKDEPKDEAEDEARDGAKDKTKDEANSTPNRTVKGYFQKLFTFYQTQFIHLNSTREELYSRQAQLESWEAIKGRQFINQESNFFSPTISVNVKRMSRSQQRRNFHNQPSIVIKNGQPSHQSNHDEYLVEWMAIKRALVISIIDYNAKVMNEELIRLDQQRVKITVEQMVSSGLFNRGSESNRFRAIIPGGEFLVNERFLTLVKGEEWLIEDEKIDGETDERVDDGADERVGERTGEGAGEKIKVKRTKNKSLQQDFKASITSVLWSIARGNLDLSYEIVRNTPKPIVNIKEPAANNNRRQRLVLIISSELDRLEEEEEEEAEEGSFCYLWMMVPKVKASQVLQSACKMVHEEIRARPGISKTGLGEVCHPFLTPLEIDVVLKIMLKVNFIEAEPTLPSHYYATT